MLSLVLLAALAADPQHITAVDVQVVAGPQHTRPESVARLMDTQPGTELDPAKLELDLARLRSTGMLYDTQATEEPAEGGERLVVKVKDKWSLMPFLTFRRGGARTTTTVGLWDNNVAGRLFTLSGEINSNADIPFYPQSSADRIGHMIFMRVPWVGGLPVTPYLEWSRNFYDFGSWQANGAPGVVYDRARNAFKGEARWDLTSELALTPGLTTYSDDFRVNNLSPIEARVPESGRTTALQLTAQYGLIREDVSRFQGTQYTLAMEAAQEGVLGSDFGYVTAQGQVRSFWVPRPGHNVAINLVGGATTARSDSHLFRAGGLSEIRGYRDSYFVGQRLVRGSAEYRAEVADVEMPLRMVWQVVGFMDGGYVTSRADAVAGLDYTGPVFSAGGGIRGNIVPFAKSVGRIDLALGFVPKPTFDIVVGTQQFF